MAGIEPWEPEALYVALCTSHFPDELGSLLFADHEGDEWDEVEGGWYQRQPVTREWSFFLRGEGGISDTDNSLSHRASLCERFCFGPASGIVQPITVRSVLLVDTPSGDCVVVGAYGSCNATFWQDGSVAKFRDPVVWLRKGVVTPYVAPQSGGFAYTDESAFAVLRHLTATELIAPGTEAAPLTVVSGEPVVCGSRIPLDLVADEPLQTQVYGVHNAAGFHIPTDQTRGLIGLRLYAGSSDLVIADLFVSYGRNAPPPAVVTSVFPSSSDKCAGGYFREPIRVNPLVNDPWTGYDGGSRYDPLNFRHA